MWVWDETCVGEESSGLGNVTKSDACAEACSPMGLEKSKDFAHFVLLLHFEIFLDLGYESFIRRI